jgi:photosystem II stability/assembly factor-like uncharacterized protein
MIDKVRSTIGLSVALCVLTSGARALEGQYTAEHFAQIQGRSIGPAGMSGRVADVDVVASDPNVIFVGSATGGVWRSVDGGIVWSPIFDDQSVLGIGAVAVSQATPDVVWVGTGEGNPRNSAGVGNGVFRSLDGGDTWTNVGLEGSERVHRIITHPSDPAVVFVAAMGPAWSDGDVRGIFRTKDGGETWDRVLYVDERTGAADLVMDPSNPNKLFAAMWEFRREPWFFESGGEGSGLFVTYDGGDSWTRYTEEDGMPPGNLGRIGLAVAPSNPDVVYALVEAEKSELLRSEDGGRSWATINDRSGVVPRPFYYADLRVDPQNENRVYSLHGSIQVSEDQGRNFETVVPSATIPGDVHELWIDPSDGRRMIIGNDGGIAFTYDRGEHWRFVENLTLAQFYHISLDNDVPFNVYGGLQDNGSWYGPSTVWENRGIMNLHWRRVGSGDGFAVFSDPTDARYGYSMSQQGSLVRFDKDTGRRVAIQPAHPDGEHLRFNWNAGLSLDPHDPSVLYLGSQFVHRTRDHGNSWEIISPDLTTNDAEKQRQDLSGGLTLDATGAENHTTILSISPSSLRPGLIWASTDDGNVQVTEDDGVTWRNTGSQIRDVPRGTWVPHVEPSHHDPNTAYVVLEDHRRGNWSPYVYKTTDLGETWSALSTNGIDGFVHVIREDRIEPNLLFLGTEFGLRVSLDGGESWIRWTHGVPPAPVRDLRVHPRDDDLVVGTHGRGAYVVDDIRPLREAASDSTLVSAPLRVLSMAPARKYATAEAVGYRSVGHAMMFGEMRPYGALINYWVGSEGDEPGQGRATIDILDVDGASMWTMDDTTTLGLNRIVWDLRRDGDDGPGSEVLAGTYTVRVTLGDAVSTGEITVVEDTREQVPVARRIAKLQALERARDMTTALREAQQRVERAIRTSETVVESLVGRSGAEALRERGAELQVALQSLKERLFTGPRCQGICGRSKLPSNVVRRPIQVLGGSPDEPTANERLILAQAEQALESILGEVNGIFDDQVSSYSRRLQEAGYSPFSENDPLTVPLEGR